MIHELARNWGWIALRGALAIVFGVLALAWPASAFAAIVLLFGAYAFVDGVFALVALFRGAGRERFWMLAIEAVVGIGIGILTIARPAATALALLYYVGIWAILTGIFELVAAIRLRKEITGEFWLGLAGVLSIVFGVVLFAAPGPAALALAVWIGAYAIVFGVMLLLLAFRLRRFTEGHRTPGGTGTPASRHPLTFGDPSIPRVRDSSTRAKFCHGRPVARCIPMVQGWLEMRWASNVPAGDLLRLGPRGGGGQLGMEEPAIPGEAAAPGPVGHDHLVCHRLADAHQLRYQPHLHQRAHRVDDGRPQPPVGPESGEQRVVDELHRVQDPQAVEALPVRRRQSLASLAESVRARASLDHHRETAPVGPAPEALQGGVGHRLVALDVALGVPGRAAAGAGDVLGDVHRDTGAPGERQAPRGWWAAPALPPPVRTSAARRRNRQF